MRPVESLYYPDNLIKGQRKASRYTLIYVWMYVCMYVQMVHTELIQPNTNTFITNTQIKSSKIMLHPKHNQMR